MREDWDHLEAWYRANTPWIPEDMMKRWIDEHKDEQANLTRRYE